MIDQKAETAICRGRGRRFGSRSPDAVLRHRPSIAMRPARRNHPTIALAYSDPGARSARCEQRDRPLTDRDLFAGLSLEAGGRHRPHQPPRCGAADVFVLKIQLTSAQESGLDGLAFVGVDQLVTEVPVFDDNDIIRHQP